MSKARELPQRAAHLWCVLIVLIGAPALLAQISPGPLARAHQSLSGGTNCTKCHEVSTKAPTFRCLECHKEIGAELHDNRGLHSTYPKGGPEGSACVKCHSDHNGEKFQMVHWDTTPSGFDHSKTGYAFDGKHVGVGCHSCHTPQHISAQARALLPNKDLSRTWMGLSRSCGTCHADKHQGRLGQDCARCHSTVDWKAASVSREGFDHSDLESVPVRQARTATQVRPAAGESVLIESLKEELFALEQDKVSGRISLGEYSEAKTGLEAMMKRVLKPNA